MLAAPRLARHDTRHGHRQRQLAALLRASVERSLEKAHGESIGIIGAARSGLLVGKDPDDPTGNRRVLASTKCNLAVAPDSLAYHIETAPNGSSVIVWEGISEHTAASLLAVPLNSDDTFLSNFQITDIPADSGRPEGVKASFTLSTKTPNGATISQDFQTTNYLRK